MVWEVIRLREQGYREWDYRPYEGSQGWPCDTVADGLCYIKDPRFNLQFSAAQDQQAKFPKSPKSTQQIGATYEHLQMFNLVPWLLAPWPLLFISYIV